MAEQVNHPEHYQSANGIECIDAIEAAVENLTGIQAFCVGNAIKYLFRAGKKDGNSFVQDVDKAQWYLQHARLTAKIPDEVKQELDNKPVGAVDVQPAPAGAMPGLEIPGTPGPGVNV